MSRPSQMPNEAARKLFLAMFFTEVLLVLFFWIDILLGSPSPVFHELVDLDGEGNLPAWFSSFQLALVSLSLWLVVAQRRTDDKPSRRFWALPATGFLLWSLDETAMLHERLTALLGSRYVDWLPDFLLSHKLLVAAAAVALLVASRIFRKDFAALWRNHRRECWFALAGFAVCAFGGAFLETIGYKLFRGSVKAFLYQTEVCFEEFFEMLGASFLLYSASSLALAGEARRQQEQSGGTTKRERQRVRAKPRPSLI